MIFIQEPVIIRGYPIPPSDNNLKLPVRRYAKGGGRTVMSFIDSPEYTQFKNDINVWFMQFNRVHHDDFQKIRKWVADKYVLGCDVDLRLHHERIWTKEGKAKMLDAPNRLKALHDSFTKLVGFNDTLFFRTEIEKVEIPAEKRECIYLKVGPIIPRKEQ